MTYIEYVIKYLKNQIPGNPIYTADIAKAFSKEYSFEIKKANAAVSVAIKRIIDTKQLENLRFYQKGIYYLAVKTPFGETGINKEILIREKYLIPDIGYETGYTVLHQMGLTTQMPNERVLVTNKARDCIRADKSLDLYIRPPKETVTQTNKRYFQFLDAVELMDKAPIDVDNPYEILAQHLNKQNLQYSQLLALADKYYNNNTIIKIAHIALTGGVTV
mgnify:FL=1